MDVDACTKDWCEKMRRCPHAEEGFEPYHKWIPIGEMVGVRSRHVTTLMCGVCFQEVNTSEAHKHRDSL